MQIPMRKLRTLAPERAEIDPIEVASEGDIRRLQAERLSWSLHHAYDNAPHYRAKFDRAGVHPDDFKTLDDLAKFPFTTKADLRENYPFGMFCEPSGHSRTHPKT